MTCTKKRRTGTSPFREDPVLQVTSPLARHDVGMWDDKAFTCEDLCTPKPTDSMFDLQFVLMSPIAGLDRVATPGRCLREIVTGLSPVSMPSPTEHSKIASWTQAAAGVASTQPGVEPLTEPCTDEIPWRELVYWLGNSATGEVECSCSYCTYQRQYVRSRMSSPYDQLSSKIPMINIMPRIEGVN